MSLLPSLFPLACSLSFLTSHYSQTSFFSCPSTHIRLSRNPYPHVCPCMKYSPVDFSFRPLSYLFLSFPFMSFLPPEFQTVSIFFLLPSMRLCELDFPPESRMFQWSLFIYFRWRDRKKRLMNVFFVGEGRKVGEHMMNAMLFLMIRGDKLEEKWLNREK